jgi:hypothetical protein
VFIQRILCAISFGEMEGIESISAMADDLSTLCTLLEKSIAEVCVSMDDIFLEDSTQKEDDCFVEVSVTEGVRQSENDVQGEPVDCRQSWLPWLFAYYDSSVEDCTVVAEKLQSKLPEGARVFGLQEAYSKENEHNGAKLHYDYRVVLWPPLPRSTAVEEGWQTLPGTSFCMRQNDVDLGFCIVPSGLKGLTTDQAGRSVLSRLMLAEKRAREKKRLTKWFGDLPIEDIFPGFNSGAQKKCD